MIGKIKRFNSFDLEERCALEDFAFRAYCGIATLSGYLAGEERGGESVCGLEEAWATTFHVKHAIACNSATSGLLAASFAAGLKPGDQFICPAMTMSATAAAPMFTGAKPFFVDIEKETFGLKLGPMPDTTKAIFSTNLFGHPSSLGRNDWDKNCGTYLIEDNAQSPFSMAFGKPVGTHGHIGVWSLNVHKPIQCGEGGVVTTDDDGLAREMRAFINHGESGGGRLGLNLRMTEACAVKALTQLKRGPAIIAGRVRQAEAILAAIGDIPGLRPPVVREGCTHVYYTIPFVIEGKRAEFCAALRAQGVPIVEGYQEPLYRLPAFAKFKRPCATAEYLHDTALFYFENCALDATPEQCEQIGAAFRKAAEMVL